MEQAKLSSKARKLLTALIISMVLLFSLNLLHTYVSLEGLSFWGYPYISSFIEDSDNPIKMKKSNCSPFISLDETKLVKISLTNTDDKDLTAFFQSVLSNPDLPYGMDHITEDVPLLAGETKVVSIEVSAANIVENRQVLVRSFVSWQPVFVSHRSIECHSVVIPFSKINSDIVGHGIFALLTLTTVILAVYFRKYDPFTIKRHRTRSSLVYLLVALIIMTIGSLTGSLLLGFSMIIFIILGFLAFWQHDFQ